MGSVCCGLRKSSSLLPLEAEKFHELVAMITDFWIEARDLMLNRIGPQWIALHGFPSVR